VRKILWMLIFSGCLAFPRMGSAFNDPSDMWWYLVQTKCVYNGSVVGGYWPGLTACPGSVQLQTVDDPAFYSKHDWPSTGGPNYGYQADDSVIGWRNGQVVVIATFDFGPPFGHYNGTNDGADVGEVRSTFAGYFYTRDGGTNQNGGWFIGPDCTSPGWCLFSVDTGSSWNSKTLAIDGQSGSLSFNSANCLNNHTATTNYIAINPLYVHFMVNGYDWGYRAVNTIVTEHWDGNRMERMYFGQNLGRYRWEAWGRLLFRSIELPCRPVALPYGIDQLDPVARLDHGRLSLLDEFLAVRW
jgi:hypothetical protein